MHECPDCGQACDCDGEDLWHEVVEECDCDCGDFDDDTDCDDLDDDLDVCGNADDVACPCDTRPL